MRSKKEKVGAIIVAAGEGKRMGDIDKVFAPLGGEPILMRATRPFQECKLIDRIVVVVSGENYEKCQHLAGKGEWSKVSDICVGGKRRQDSVAAGLQKIGDCGWVAIHDGARPLVTVEMIERGLAAARKTGSAAAAVPVTDTIKVVGSDEIVYETPPRQNLRAVQTPQVFRIDIIKDAYKKLNKDVTDDAAMVEQAGYEVKLYSGSYDNIKITTPDDLKTAGVLLEKHEK